MAIPPLAAMQPPVFGGAGRNAVDALSRLLRAATPTTGLKKPRTLAGWDIEYLGRLGLGAA